MAKKRSFFSRLWEAITGGEKPKEIIPEPTRTAPPPPPPPREPEYVPTSSDDNERIANRLIRIYRRHRRPSRRHSVDENHVRRNVESMPDDVKEIARTADPDEIMMYARYAEYADDDGHNYFWYH